MNKSWKADIEFEAIYESAYKQKVDSRNLHPLQRKEIKAGSIHRQTTTSIVKAGELINGLDQARKEA